MAAQPPSFTPAGGIFSIPCVVTIQGNEGYEIHYTLNGTTPTADDKLYTAPLYLSEQLYSHSDLYRLRNCPENLWTPRDEVDHLIVLRAALFAPDGSRCSDVRTEVYLVKSLLHRDMELPVVSLCIDSADLFDFDSGIFVPGTHFDPTNLYFSGNYCQRGREWERHADFTFIDNGTTVLSQSCGIRIHGNRTRCYQQKGFTLYARKEYGTKQFAHPFFGSGGPDRYKRLILRPWAAGWNDSGIPDYLCQRLAATLGCDHLLTRPVALFLNGEYWGLYFMQEKPDEHYIEQYYNIDKDNVDILANWGQEVENGDATRWNAFYQWLETADLTREADYQYAIQQIDIDALIDYMLLQVFVSNIDWPANNVRLWSANGSPWRWFFFDGDAAFARWNDNKVILNQLVCNDPSQTYPSSPFATRLFRQLLSNNDFKLYTIEYFYRIVHDRIGINHAEPILQDIISELSNEVIYQSARFGNPVGLDEWLDYTNDVRRYLVERTVSMPDDYARLLGFEPNNIKITLFPNPSPGSATLLCSSECGNIISIEILNAIGQRIYRQNHILSTTLNPIALPTLPQGIYFVRTSVSSKPFRWVVR